MKQGGSVSDWRTASVGCLVFLHLTSSADAGIEEEDLLSEMVALTPMSAKRLLDELLGQELVLVNIIKYTPAGPPRCLGGEPRAERVSHLAFLPHLHSFDLSAQPVVMQEAKHYFADPRNCFSKTATVRPVL